jgi:putative ABC transport system substrate-binding protein
MHSLAAVFTDKMLRGALPQETPAQQPANYELVINLQTAKALGITLPPTLLAEADEVIE